MARLPVGGLQQQIRVGGPTRTYINRIAPGASDASSTLSVSGLTTGALLVVLAGARSATFSGNTQVLTISDSLGGLTWTKIESEGAIGGQTPHQSCSIHYATVGATTSGDVTFTTSDANGSAISIEAYQFTNWSSVGGTANERDTTGGTGNRTATLTAAPDSTDITIAMLQAAHATPTAPTGADWTGNTELYEASNNASFYGLSWQINARTGSTSATLTWNTSLGFTWYEARKVAIVVKGAVASQHRVTGHTNTTDVVAAAVSTTPTGSGVTRTPAANVAAVQSAVNASGPGDVIRIAAGSYATGLTIAVSGTLANPIVIAPASGAAVNWTGGQIAVTGSYVQITGIEVSTATANAVHISGTARDIRINNCTFSGGSGEGASSVGCIYVAASSSWAGYGDGFSTNPQPIQITRNVVIDGNFFDQPANCCLWVNHGSTGVDFCHNRILGPSGIASGESEAVKFGHGVGFSETSDSNVSWNTFENWVEPDLTPANPYVIGLKMSGVKVVGNRITKGRIELRAMNDCQMLGNVIEDGDMVLRGSGHTVSYNYVKTTTSRDGFGPLKITPRCGFDPYDGNNGDNSWFNAALRTSTLAFNSFVTNTEGAFATLYEYQDYATLDITADGNTFTSNGFWGNASYPLFNSTSRTAAAFIAGNTWNTNIQVKPTTPSNALGGTNTVSSTTITPKPSAPTTVALTPSERAYR